MYRKMRRLRLIRQIIQIRSHSLTQTEIQTERRIQEEESRQVSGRGSKNAVFQYNECFKTLNASKGNGDGQPWDADYGDGTNYQYNYSHGNTASTIMFCGGESINNTFRYNIAYMKIWDRLIRQETQEIHRCTITHL